MIRSWFKVFYAVEFIGVGVFMPYMAMFFIRKNLTSIEVGYLLAITPFAGFISQPFWGLISDKLNLTRTLVTIGCFVTSVLVLALTFTDSFWALLLIVAIMSIIRSPIHPNVAALALSHLESRGKQDEYGKFRLWGSVGFVLATVFAGGLLFEDNLSLTIYIYSISMFILGVISFFLPDRQVSSNIQWKDGLSLLSGHIELRVLLIGIVCVGVTLGITNQYLVVYLNELDASAWMIGATVAISAIPEIPIMSYAEKLIRKWGLRITYLVGLSVLPLRWFLNMMITDSLVALYVQTLHGIAIGSLLCIGVIYVDRILPVEWRASGQALYVSSLHGLGPSLGLFVAGLIMTVGNTRLLWALCLVVGILGTYIIRHAMYIKSNNTT